MLKNSSGQSRLTSDRNETEPSEGPFKHQEMRPRVQKQEIILPRGEMRPGLRVRASRLCLVSSSTSSSVVSRVGFLLC